MKNDPGSNMTIAAAVASDTYTDAATEGASVDHSTAPAVTFFISTTAVGTTLDMKTQYSSDDSSWTDYASGNAAGNDVSITQLDDAGSAKLDVPNPVSRYTRVLATSVGACEFCVVSVLGPLRSVVPS